jgi:hypothetical protein
MPQEMLENRLAEDCNDEKPTLRERLYDHFVDTTATTSVFNPIYALAETQVLGIEDSLSIRAKFLAAIVGYAGMGTAYKKGLDLSHRLFNITKKTSKAVRAVHDALYGAVFMGASTPCFYLVCGSRDWKELLGGIGIGACIGIIAGIPNGYSIRTFRDCMDLDNEAPILPESISNKPGWMKKSLAGLIALGSAAGVALYYWMRS